MDMYVAYIYLIFVFKITFIGLAIYAKMLERRLTKQSDTTHTRMKSGDNAEIQQQKAKLQNVLYWKDRVDFIFDVLIAVLMIYLFFPSANRLYLIGTETKMLLCMFGILFLIEANWADFLGSSVFLQYIQAISGR